MKKRNKELKNRTRREKKGILIVLLLLGALMSSYSINAATNDVGEPTVVVSNYEQLLDAMKKAENGDSIGIDGMIAINNNVHTLGYEDKRINIIRMSEEAYFEVNQSVPLTVRNMVFDGKMDKYRIVYEPMFAVKSNTIFENVMIHNCNNLLHGGAIQVWQNTTVNVDNCTFRNNHSNQGGHICLIEYTTVNLNDSILEDGGAIEGGAICVADITAKLNVKSCVFHGNIADCGGGIHNHGMTDLHNTVIYGNRANFGADIANQITSHFQIESLEQLIPVYKTHGILPKQWVNDMDYSKMTPNLIEPSEENSLMKLVYDVIDIPAKPTETETEQTEAESKEKETGTEKQPESESESKCKPTIEIESESGKPSAPDLEPEETIPSQSDSQTESSTKQPEVEQNNVSLAVNGGDASINNYTGWRTIKKKKYYYTDGKLAKGWKTFKKKRYYFKKGLMQTGQVRIKGKYYYFNTKGVMQRNKWIKIKGYKYYFNKKGIRTKKKRAR